MTVWHESPPLGLASEEDKMKERINARMARSLSIFTLEADPPDLDEVYEKIWEAANEDPPKFYTDVADLNDKQKVYLREVDEFSVCLVEGKFTEMRVDWGYRISWSVK